MKDIRSYIARETAINAVINGVMSAVFFLVMFAIGEAVQVWGLGNYAFDFLIQSFAVGFFASFVPSVQTRAAIKRGAVVSARQATGSVGSLVLYSIAIALVTMLFGAALCTAALWLSGAQTIAYLPAFLIKVVYGGILGSFVAYCRLKRQLG